MTPLHIIGGGLARSEATKAGVAWVLHEELCRAHLLIMAAAVRHQSDDGMKMIHAGPFGIVGRSSRAS